MAQETGPREAVGELNRGERSVANLARVYVEAGGDLRLVLAETGVAMPAAEFLSGGLKRTPPETLHRIRDVLTGALARRAANQTGRAMIRSPDWQMLFYCLANARTLREAIERFCDMVTVMDGRCGRMSFREGAAESEVVMDSQWPVRSLVTFAVDSFGLAVYLDIFGWLIGQTLPVTRVMLDYPLEMLQQFDSVPLPDPLTMGAGRSSVIFASRLLDYPVVRGTDDCDSGIRTILSSLFDIPSGGPRERLAERVRRLMLTALREDGLIPSPEALSDRIGCSKPQLRRWLADQGMSYSDIKESCRRELALDLLQRSQLPIEEISARLGYWDSDAFRLAIRKWTGTTPTEFRKSRIRR